MKLLPICLQTHLRVIRHAAIDDEYYDLLSQRTWYLSSRHKPLPPRFSKTLGVEGGTVQLCHFHLHRVVQAFAITSPEEQLALWSDLGKLWNFLYELPRVKFHSADPFDCRRANLTIQMLPETLKRREREINPLLLPVVAPVTTLSAEQFIPAPEPDFSSLLPTDDSDQVAKKFMDFLGSNPEPEEQLEKLDIVGSAPATDQPTEFTFGEEEVSLDDID